VALITAVTPPDWAYSRRPAGRERAERGIVKTPVWKGLAVGRRRGRLARRLAV
jgi:hypothetical protein